MILNILEILVLVSLVQGVLFSFVILTQNRFKVKANKYLAYSVLLLSYIGIAELLRAKDLHKEYYTVGLIDNIPWLLLFYVPMLIYFAKSVNYNLGKSKRLLFLILPFFAFLVLNVLIILHHEFKLIYIDFIQEKYRLIYEVEFYFSIIFNVILCTFSYFIVKKSTISDYEKKWLKNIWLFNAMLLLIWVVRTCIPQDMLPFENKDLNYPVWLGVSVFVYWLILKGLIELKLSQDKSEIHGLLKGMDKYSNPIKRHKPDETDDLSRKVTKEENLDSSSIHKQSHFNKFIELMVKEKLYRNPDLSRDIVANKLNMSVGYLSQLISASVNSNFTSLINDYRVEDVKKMLLNSDFDKYSIVAIGLEAGFKSKSTFYSEFKKKTGHTPNQYKLINKS